MPFSDTALFVFISKLWKGYSALNPYSALLCFPFFVSCAIMLIFMALIIDIPVSVYGMFELAERNK